MENNYIVELINYEKRGANLLEGIMPRKKRDDEDGELTVRRGSPVITDDYLYYVTSDQQYVYDYHVDIDGAAFTLSYDMGEEKKVDYFYVSTYRGTGDGPYAIGKFEIYASKNLEDLLEVQNRVAFVDNDNCVLSKDLNSELFGVKIDAPCECRYVAFKQLNTNDTGAISRIATFGAYNKENDFIKRYVEKNFESCLNIEVTDAKGVVSGNTEFVTDGVVFDDGNALTLNNGEVTIKPNYKKAISQVIVIAKKISDMTFIADVDYGVIKGEYKDIEYDRQIITYNLENTTVSEEFTLKFDGEAVIDQILARSNFVEIDVDTDNVITEDYLGLGANVLPTHLFECGRQQGFNEAYFEVEKRRIDIAKPSVVRMWFQVDWFVMDEDGYLNREYCFNSPKMKAVYKELDAFKESDVEVELNFGWKIGSAAQEWFSFPNVFNRRCSAPRDLDHFATSCSDCLKELIVNRGYDNIKYLTFYNESNGGVPNGWDFICPAGTDLKAYWKEMLLKVDKQLRIDGMRDKIKFWVAETSGEPSDFMKASVGEWLDYFNKEVGYVYEYATFHQYRATYEQGVQNAREAIALSNHPSCLTEFAVYDTIGRISNGIHNFNQNNIAAVLGYMNGGISAMLFWILSGSWVEEGFWHNGDDTAFWCAPVSGKKEHVDQVSIVAYQFSLFTNYIPRHSKIIKTTVLDDGAHAVAAITPDGNYTVAIESKAGIADKKIAFNFGQNIDKKFYKHVFDLNCNPDGNMTIPPAVAEIEVGDTLCDTIDSGYSFVLYTSITPREQVVLDKCYVKVCPGEQVQLSAKAVDSNSKIKWSLCDVYTCSGYKGTLTEDGLYTADEEYYDNLIGTDFGTNAVFAAKAELESGEYSICVIEVCK